MKKLRLAVIGAGHLGRIHARLARSLVDVQLAAVVDPNPAAQRAVQSELDVPVLESHHQLPRQIDAAIVATPTRTHYNVARDLLHRGMHLLVEKPLASNVQQAGELVRLARRQRCVLQVGHVERFNAAWNAVRPYLAQPVLVEAAREGRHTFRSTDIGVVLDLMIHDIDLVLSLTRSPVVDVQATGFSAFGHLEDVAFAWLSFSDGLQARLTASRVSCQPRRTMRIFSRHDWAEIDFAASSARTVHPGRRVHQGDLHLDDLDSGQRQELQENLFTNVLHMEDVDVEQRNALLDEQHDFVISIRTRAQPVVPGEAGLAALDVAERILHAMDVTSWTSTSQPAAAHAAAALAAPAGPDSLDPQATPPRRRAG